MLARLQREVHGKDALAQKVSKKLGKEFRVRADEPRDVVAMPIPGASHRTIRPKGDRLMAMKKATRKKAARKGARKGARKAAKKGRRKASRKKK